MINRNSKGQFIKGYTQPTAKVIKKGQRLALGYKWTEKQKKKNNHLFFKGITPWNKGKECSYAKGNPNWIKGFVPWNKEIKFKAIMGENHWNWQGGRTSVNEKLRKSVEYKLWRQAVFERDNYTCVWCRQIGGELNADHIKPFSKYPELRFAIDNGRTLCHDCHKITNTYGKGALTWQEISSHRVDSLA